MEHIYHRRTDTAISKDPYNIPSGLLSSNTQRVGQAVDVS